MKTIILSLVLGLFLAVGSVNAQNDHLNAGFGLSGWGIPVYVSYDLNVADNINVGGGLSFQSKTESWGNGFGSANYRHTIIGIQGIGQYYFDELIGLDEQFDVYGGASLGFYIWNTNTVSNANGFSDSYSGSGSGGLSLGLIAGGRYYFNDQLGVNLELGAANILSGARLGVSWKM